MSKPVLIHTEFDFDRSIWWAYFDSEGSGASDYKKFGINNLHYKFQAKIDFKKNDECKNYLLKRAQEYKEQFDDFSEMPGEKILGVNDK